MNRKLWIPILLLASATTPALAADNGIYLGAGIGYSNVDVDDFDFSGDATGYKVIAGWRVLDWLAVEGNYVGVGEVDDEVEGEDVEADIDGFTLSALVFMPVGPVDLFARAGLFSWNADFSFDDINSGDDGTDFVLGVGAQFRLGSLALRAEFERFELDQASTNMFTAGVTWTFL